MSEVPLREYVERRIDDLTRECDGRFAALQAGMEKSEAALIEDVQRVDRAVLDLQRSKANLDGRLFILNAVIATFVSALVTLLLMLLVSRI